MAASRKGKWISPSPARKVVLEYLHHARMAPTLPLSKRMNLAHLATARKQADISWTAIFMRAFGLVALARPPLRQCFLSWPWPHYYEHPQSECAILTEREYQGEAIILGAKVRAPEAQTLPALHAKVKEFQSMPLEEIGYFRQLLRLGRLPWLVRRFVFWTSLHWSGYLRSKRFGTFIISSLGNMGVEQHHPISPHTTYLTFGAISPEGDVDVKIIYDHRVMDGRTVARCLLDLEQVLQTQMVQELKALAPSLEARAA